MTTHAPEKELLHIYPRSHKMTAILLGIGLIFLATINWKKFDLSTFEPLDHLQLWLLIIAFTISLFPRLTITTTHIRYTFGPFFKKEINKDKIEDIYISPPLNYLRFTQRDTIWTKPLFGKARHPNTPEYWYKQGILNFKHTQHIKSFRQMSLTKLGLVEYSSQQIDDIIKTIEQYWQFNASRVEISPVDQQVDDLTTQDIGHSVIALIFIAIFTGFIGFLIPISLLDGLHFAVESYLYLIPLTLMSIALCYFIIKREKKNYPFISAVLVGLIWGGALYLTSLQINRLYSEHHAKSIIVPMTLSSHDGRSQIWTLDKKWQTEIGLNEIYIHQNWQGYNTNAKQGQTSSIKVKQGLFKDYFLTIDSFKEK